MMNDSEQVMADTTPLLAVMIRKKHNTIFDQNSKEAFCGISMSSFDVGSACIKVFKLSKVLEKI